VTCPDSSHRPNRFARRLTAVLGLAAAVPARAQVDTVSRNLIEIGYDQTAVGRGPQAEYAYYYYNRPDYFAPNVGLRAALAPAYLDSEIGFRHLLSPSTDVGFGLAGGAFGDNFYDVAQGQYRENESFDGSGGGATLSVYQLLNPGDRIPLNLMVRGGFRYSTYFDTSDTAKNFKLPSDQLRAYTRIGLRFGGRQPLLFPALGLELSAWFERERDFDAMAYGFDGDRRLSPGTDLYWAYAGLNYQFKASGDQMSFGLTAGGSTDADLFSAWRLGGVLPLVAEYPLMVPGYYYEELTAIRFAHLYAAYAVPLDQARRWDVMVEAAAARLDYLPGYEQRSDWQSGAGLGLGFSPKRSRYKVILRCGYGFNALRSGKDGAESVGLLFQWDLSPRKRQIPLQSY
jgi:hypothetical protein